ncbi:MAG TPA: glycerol-3-phosphate responsive antiterminator [Terriglobales bacterium]|jgi:glycerol uptake operon antiterminator
MNDLVQQNRFPRNIHLAEQPRVFRNNGKFKPGSREGMFPSETDERPLVQDELCAWLEQSRVIPALRNVDSLPAACASPSKIIFLLFGTPLIIGDLVSRLRDAGKLPVANMDLLAGFARDAAAIEFLAKSGVAGIISTHQDTLRTARSHGLLAFQRTFALDSVAVSNSVRTLQHFLPDVVELLPAVAAPFILPMLRAARPNLPVIGCGLVRYLSQIDELVKQGITSVSVSEPSLWIL